MKKIISILCVTLCIALLGVSFLPMFNKQESAPSVRTIELSASSIDSSTCYSEFDSYDITYEEGQATFVGLKSFSMEELYDLDLVSDKDVNISAQARFVSEFDYENGIVTLSAIVDDGESTAAIDKIYGIIIADNEGHFDAMFDIDGKTVLLSEMAENETVDTCGLFSRILGTKIGKIGTIVTVAACAVVGVVCAVVPGGQLVTAACIGAAVGLVGAATTAALTTYYTEGKVDWTAVIEYGFTGLFVGAGISVVSFEIATNAIGKVQIAKLIRLADNNPASKITIIGKFLKDSYASYEKVAGRLGANFFSLDNWDQLVSRYGADVMKLVNKLWLQAKVLLGNEIYLTSDPATATGAFAEEIKWLAELGYKTFVEIVINGEHLWKAIK